ncbi:MAG TPA: rod shape-determining protein MreD [Steroidobacteraceae bacterium]|jgi:rod shape-determining protein MreD|nr:rod shape-determining protein MreD [Steroidobacteraceae bacterium]
MSERHPRTTVVLTSLVALVLSLVPLPHWAAILRPAFLVLVVLYWSTMLPRAGGMTLGFGGGMTLDAFHGAVLGEHALALSFVTYLAIRLNLLVRAKPLFEQSLFVFAALMAYEFLLWVIDGWSGYPLSTPTRWVHTLTGGLIWPLVVGILGRFHATR